MRSYKLFDRTKSSTPEFASRSIGSRRIRIHNANQLDGHSFFGQLLIDPGVIAPEGAHANGGDVDDVFRSQLRFLGQGARRA